MTTRRIRNWWWVDFRVEGIRYRKRSPSNTWEAAKNYENLLRSRLAQGKPVIPPPPVKKESFADFSARWFATYVKTNNKPSEQRAKEHMLRLHLVPWFGRMTLQDISARNIEEYKAAKLKTNLAPKSINNQLTVLRKCLRTALFWDELDRVPHMSLLHTRPIERDFLTVEESERLIVAATSEPFWRAIIILALRTGMRYGEMAGLRWTDVDFTNNLLTINQSFVDGVMGSPKNHQARTIPFPDSVKTALLALPRVDGLVFSRPTGEPLCPATAKRALHHICQAANLRLVGWHTLRHSCASQIGMLRGTLLEAQRLLGHSTLAMTERYTHLVPTALREAVRALDEAAKVASPRV